MESTALNKVHKFVKFFKFIAMIVFVMCMIGAVAALAAYVLVAMNVISTMYYEGASVSYLIEYYSGMTLEVIKVYCEVGFINCLCGAIMAKMTHQYLKDELLDGTPFTFEGAKQLKTLGIIYIVLPLVCGVIQEILTEVMLMGIQHKELSISLEPSIGFGLLVIALSYVFQYGAEVLQENSLFTHQEDF